MTAAGVGTTKALASEVTGGSASRSSWLRLPPIGDTYLGTNPVTDRVHPFLQELADPLNMSVALAVPEQLDMPYFAAPSRAPLRHQ